MAAVIEPKPRFTFCCAERRRDFLPSGRRIAALLHGLGEPAPVKAYRKHHDSILAYTESIKAGRIPVNKGVHGGYALLDVLCPEGLTAVEKTKDGSIHFVFESLPPDSTPSLVYCPRTSFDVRRIDPIGGTSIVKGECLDPHWFYCEADFP